MKNTLNYRGITLTLKQSTKNKLYFGKLNVDSKDEITFECYRFSRIKKCFEEVVEDYLSYPKSDSDNPFLIHYIDTL